MEFALSEEQVMLQDMVRASLARALPPTVLRDALERSEHDLAISALQEAGVLGMIVPETLGGAGLGLLDAALVAECCGEVPLPELFIGHTLASLALSLSHPGDVGDTLARATAGDALLTIAVDEPEQQAEPRTFRTSFVDGQASGEKVAVTGLGPADHIVAITQGCNGALVDKSECSVLSANQPSCDLSVPLHRLVFEGVPAKGLEIGEASYRRVRAAGQVLWAADSLGAASALLAETIRFVQDRQQFGQPLSNLQAVRHELADIAADVESARSLVWYAAAMLDDDMEGAARTAQLCKAHVSQISLASARRCVVLHGAMGFAWECDVHWWLKRIMSGLASFGLPRALRAEAARQSV